MNNGIPDSDRRCAMNTPRTPHDVPDLPLAALVQRWQDARLRSFLAAHGIDGTPNPKDLFAELTLGAHIAREATTGRWCVVADLLRLGAVDSWCQVGEALGITETDARDGFTAWISGQVNLHRSTGRLGLTDTDADELHGLSEAVTW